uniref:DUF148 domain-containing protein n=1 Tax=Panagrellus redivivus TaxID=6233 RepID=A0A7E4VNE9_PANRE
MIAQDDATASTLSPDAQTLYNETKAIAINNDLTSDQICSQLTTLYANASQSAIGELAQAFPQYANVDMCKNHKKHSNPRQKRQMYQNYRYDSPEFHSPEYNSRESWERYGNRQGYQNGNLRNQGQYYYGNGQQQQQQRYGRQAYRWDSPEDRYDDSHEWNRNGYGNQGGYRTQGGYGNQGYYGYGK